MSVIEYVCFKIRLFKNFPIPGERHGKNFARPDPLELGLRCYCIMKVDVVTKMVFTLNLYHFARFLGSFMEWTRH